MKTLILITLLSTSLFAFVLPDTVVGLTVLVDFPGQEATIDRSIINEMMNGDTFTEYNNYGSVYQYFKENSHNRFHYKNIVTEYVRTNYSRAFYDVFDTTLVKSEVLVKEVLNSLKQSGFDFSKLTQRNGTVVALNVLYAGGFKGVGYVLRPHEGALSETLEFESAVFHSFQISPLRDDLDVSTVIHENGHLLFGWEDLYASVSKHSYGVGEYSLMSHNMSYRPQPPNAYYRFLAGWVDTVDITGVAVGSEYTLYPNDSIVYVYRKEYAYGDTTGFFFLEYKTQDGWAAEIPDEGLAVWEVNLNGKNTSTGSANFIDLIQVDGRDDLANKLNKGDTTDLFKTGDILNDTTVPNALWKGRKPSLFKIYDLEVHKDSLVFKTGSEISTAETEDIVFYENEYLYNPKLTDVEESILENGELHLIPTGTFGGSVIFSVDSMDINRNVSDLNYLSMNVTHGNGYVSVGFYTIMGNHLYRIDAEDGIVTINISGIPSIQRSYFDNIRIAFKDTVTLNTIMLTRDSVPATIGYEWATGPGKPDVEPESSSEEIIWNNTTFEGVFDSRSSVSSSSDFQSPIIAESRAIDIGRIRLVTPADVFSFNDTEDVEIFTLTGTQVYQLPNVRNQVYVVVDRK